ncbi:MAG: helix-hairpin-helix domain-containing protein [Bacteroidales bacterium]|nr:helix-hairpin-helix domain-containing protein [Bacteroidales bacterium]
MKNSIKYGIRLLATSTLFFSVFCTFAQEKDNDLPLIVNDIIEDHAQNRNEETDYSRLIDELNFRLRNPLNLNTAKEDDLRYFIFLNDIQIRDILNLRNKLGKIDNLFQLQLVESLSFQDIQNLKHFVYAGPLIEKTSGKLKRSLHYGRHDIFMRYERTLEQKQGYKPLSGSHLSESPNRRYLGSPDKYYLKYHYRSRNIRWGINAEKDPGEEFFKGTQPLGFDFYSGYVMVEDIKWLDKLIIGDYNMQAAQGLAMWSGLSFGKSSGVASVRKQAGGISPNTSMSEFGYFRGIAVEKVLGDFYTTVFYSRTKRDANINSRDTLGDYYYITSLQQTGYHNTESLVKNKDAVNEQLLGGNVFTKFGNLKLGVTAYAFELEMEMETPAQLYNKFDFSGNRQFVNSLDYEYNLRNIIFFGETAYSGNNAWGTLNGFIVRPVSGVFLSVLHRWYQRDFQSTKGGAFGENSANQNEKGLFTGLKIQLNRRITFNAYTDLFRFDWLNYRVDAPSCGSEYRLKMEYTPSRKWNADIRYQYEHKMINRDIENVIINKPGDRKKQRFRLNISWKATKWLKLNNRAAWSFMNMENQEPQDGWLLYQDILIRPDDKPYAFSFRYALFNTDSYDARLYAYEHDVLYAFAIPAYYYQGFRTYLLVKYELSKTIDFWLKIARSQYTDRTSVSSGLAKIDKPAKTDVKLQIRIKF